MKASEFLKKIGPFELAKKNHNLTHGLLMVSFQVMKDYYSFDNELKELGTFDDLVKQLKEMTFVINYLACPPI